MTHPRSTIGKLLQLLRAINIHPGYLLIPISLSIVAAASEGFGMSLLVPLLQGFLAKNFAFLRDTPILQNLFAMLQKV